MSRAIATALDEVAAALGEGFRGVAERDYPVATSTTYRLGGRAALYVEPGGPDDVARLGRALREAGIDSATTPILPLGRGSNLVVSDHGLPGLVIRMGAAASWIEPAGRALLDEGAAPGAAAEEWVRAGAATSLPQLANWSARRGLTGLEWAVAIPGSVGGAVRMNAGAYGSEMSDVLISASVFDLCSLELEDKDRTALALRYRTSILTERHLVVAATFGLGPGDRRAIRAQMNSHRRHRADTQPGGANNAGSVFKNPPGDSAGRLVESSGLKGRRVGGVRVSDLHANFFVAEPGAHAQDVYDLVHMVRAVVYERTGIDLEPEIRFVGRFSEAAE